VREHRRSTALTAVPNGLTQARIRSNASFARLLTV
jgi:hypothetical protein